MSPDPGISLHQQKSPTRHLGASGIALSREERGPLRHGRVAWLTAFQPITVAGPRPIHTAFPATLACKLNHECKLQRSEVSMEVALERQISTCCLLQIARKEIAQKQTDTCAPHEVLSPVRR